jgi:hypothetical protein
MQSYLGEGWAICRVVLKKAEQYAELSRIRLNNMQSYLKESWRTICRVIWKKTGQYPELSVRRLHTAQRCPGESRTQRRAIREKYRAELSRRRLDNAQS